MQDANPMPWGALDRFQAHYIVRRAVENDGDAAARTVLATSGRFGAKRVTAVSWNGAGKLAAALNGDGELSAMIAERTPAEASITVEPTPAGVRIHAAGWSDHLGFGITEEMFRIYDRIAGHVRSL